MRSMVEAADAGLREQHRLDTQMGRGSVQYPMQVGEPERSERRGYDDGSAGDAAKYDDCGGYDDDNMSDFSGNNSDGQYYGA